MLSPTEIIGLVGIAGIHLAAAGFVYSDAARRHLNAALWALLVTIVPILGAAAYACYIGATQQHQGF
jgi:hypothetical protein